MAPSSLYAELAPYYDRIYAAKEYASETRTLTRIARKALGRPGSTLLDVGCGTGRHLELFRRDFRVAGVDVSRSMLAVARRRLGARVPLTLGDMRNFSLGRQYDVVTCLFSAIGFMNRPADRHRAIANLYRHVTPGGVALVEGWVRPSRWRGDGVGLDTYDGPECKVARVTHAYRQGNLSVLDMHYLIGEPKKAIRYVAERHRHALIEPEEMLDSFRRAGFRARVILSGAYRDRGLYVGIRPASPGRSST